ncbi:MAG: exodeoxyribonuclease VII large subunit [Alphaproteobacteria bacterium]
MASYPPPTGFEPDLAPNEGAGNAPILTVGELAFALKRTVEDAFGRVRLRGEISGFKRHTSGHCYFRLKDMDAAIEAVLFRGSAGKLTIKPEDGMEVIATGRVTTYPGRSQYQIIVDTVELAGQGALLKLIEDRRKRLEAEGLFDQDRKRPLPFLPDVIGVVTSPTGAVIRDILHRLNDRFPRHVLLWPVLVQGDGAAEQVARAIKGFNALERGGAVPRPDLLIVARGGGSLEDLMAFNEEAVIRAAAESDIPLISAVGHETDTTLIDFASDRRAPTPTAAAEMAVPVRADLLAQVMDDGTRLVRGFGRGLQERAERLGALARVMGDPQRLIEDYAQRLDDRWERLRLAGDGMLSRFAAVIATAAAALRPQRLQALLEQREERLETAGARLAAAGGRALMDAERHVAQLGKLLDSYSHKSVLARGFALVVGPDGHLVGSAAASKAGDTVALRFHDGERAAVIDGEDKKAVPMKPAKPKTPVGGGTQGSLL